MQTYRFIKICFIVAGLTAGLYLSELFLLLTSSYFRLRCLPFRCDKRSIAAVVYDDRLAGNKSYPAVHPRHLMMNRHTEVFYRELLPLGGISHVSTVLCNERGRPVRYHSGRYGFRNSEDMQTGKENVVFLGDSFTQGFCIDDVQHFSSAIREEGYRTWNFGSSGNGPLAEYASFQEYAVSLEPKFVFWFFYEGNDFEDFDRELHHPLLRRYLSDSNFHQDLRNKQDQIDRILTEYVDQRLREYQNSFLAQYLPTRRDAKRSLYEWSRLYNLRLRIGLANKRNNWQLERPLSQETLSQLTTSLLQILKDVNTSLGSWGGQLIFVYLPAWQRYSHGQIRRHHPQYQLLREGVQRLGVPILDIAETFAEQEDPLVLFPARMNLHYNEDGYHLIAKELRMLLKDNDDPHALS